MCVRGDGRESGNVRESGRGCAGIGAVGVLGRGGEVHGSVCPVGGYVAVGVAHVHALLSQHESS
jgi:hypothetical protein